MTAKEIQSELIKTYLKPTMKNYAYKLNGQTWWKQKADFFIVINLQNFSWNNKDNVDFCFNTGIGLGVFERTKPSIHNSVIYIREGFYLPEERKTHPFRNTTGYILQTGINYSDFLKEIKLDFEDFILSYFEKIDSLEDILKAFGQTTFWGERLREAIENYNALKIKKGATFQ